MPDPSPQEPTMEEILASIRRIISEDDAPADKGDAAAPAAVEAAPGGPVAEAPPPLSVVEPEPEPDEADDVLELTEPLAAEPEPEDDLLQEPMGAIGDLEVFAPPPPRRAAPVAAAEPYSPPPAYDDDGPEDGLVSAPAAQEAASSFFQLARTVSMPTEGHSLEEVVRELLKPLLRDWLDKNLPSIVEDQVRAEVERISRKRV